MSTETAPKKPRTKPEGPRNHVITVDGKEWLLKCDNVRVATSNDFNKALDGDMPKGVIVDNKTNTI